MDEEIEVLDVYGTLVRISFYGTLSALGAHLTDGESKAVRRADGRQVELSLREDGYVPWAKPSV